MTAEWDDEGWTWYPEHELQRTVNGGYILNPDVIIKLVGSDLYEYEIRDGQVYVRRIQD